MYRNNQKQWVNLTFLVCTLLFCSSGFGQTIENGLVAYWNFEDGTASDSSGNGHDCIEVGTVNYVYDSQQGGTVLSLDGMAGNYLNAVGGNGGWATFTESMTYCAWVKVDAFTLDKQCLIGTNGSYRLGRNGTTNTMRLWNDGLGGTLSGTSDVADNQWHHVCGVIDSDGSSTVRRLYVDGQLENSDTAVDTLDPLETDLIIGADGTSYPEREWNGLVDDVRIYDRALSDEEVGVLAGNGTAYNFSPSNGQGGLNPVSTVLSWSAGWKAVTGYNVYLGTDQAEVSNGTGDTKVSAMQTQTNFTLTLAESTIYYWRVEDVSATTVSSSLMSFTTRKATDPTLLGWWEFEESTAGVTPDSSGNERDGTLVGDCELVNDLQRGMVLRINSTDNSWVNCGGGGLQGWANQPTFSVTAWVKVDSFHSSEQFIASNGISYMVGRYGTADHLRFSTSGYADAEMVADQLEGRANIQDGQWHFVVFTYNKLTGGRYLHVDSKNDISAGPQSYVIDLDQTVDDFLIGGYLSQPGSCWKGLIDDVRLYNIALSRSQIQILNGGPYAVDPSPQNETGNYNINSLLSWRPGESTRQTQGHDLYFGTDWYDVKDSIAAVHIGLQDSNSYDPGKLKSGTTYYWRVDQIDTASQTHTGYIWSFRTETQGYYMDLFKDSGVNLNRCTEMPAADLLALTTEWVSLNNTESVGDPVDQAIQDSLVIGNKYDDNGVYLYPDRQPRFRAIYVDGGGAGKHTTSYGPVGVTNINDFVANGGSYSGSCAGAYAVRALANWPGSWGGGIGADIRINYTIPEDSPLLNYYSFAGGVEGNLEIADVEHWGGPWWSPDSDNYKWYPGTEVLAVYNDSITDAKANPCVSVFGYKANQTSGRAVPIGSHPERVPEGKQRDLMAGVLLYALDGNGQPDVKASLENGDMRWMYSNVIAGHEKIGDKQYHHYTIEIPPNDHNDIKITLFGDGKHDLNLYARYGDFAFEGEDDTIEAINDSSSNEVLEIENPQSGIWYIGVKGVETIARTIEPWGWRYTGNLDVLNGVPYAIGVNVNLQLQLRKMAFEWLTDNKQLIPKGNPIGQWNFDDGNANDSSGNGNDGILKGNSKIVYDSQMGSVLELDGDGDYVDLGDGSWTNPGDSLTITAWIKVDVFDVSYQTIFAKGLSTYRLGRGGDDTLQVYMDYNTSHDYNSAIGETNVNDGQWHHTAVTYDGNIMKLYIDGLEEDNNTLSTLNTTSAPLMIGRNSDKTARDWQGWIDDVRLYNYTLDSDDIWRIYTGSQLLNEYECVNRPLSDINGDCLVNLLDFAILANSWLK